MCYQGCIYENYHGDCCARITPGWICPHDLAKCENCGKEFHVDDLDENFVCEACATKDD